MFFFRIFILFFLSVFLFKVKAQDSIVSSKKIIRKIDIKTFDPFGYSENDTINLPTNNWEKWGNILHIQTRKFTLKNLLLFKEKELLDSLKIKESERIINSQNFIKKVSIQTIPVPNSNDSIDIHIRSVDLWSIFPSSNITATNAFLGLSSYNFLGLGHYFNLKYHSNLEDNKHGFSTQYQISNILNSFINIGGFYNIDLDNNYSRSLYLNRPFYSNFTRVAGGVSLSQTLYKQSLFNQYDVSNIQGFKSNVFNLWTGYSIPITSDYRSNFILSARLFVRKYLDKIILKDSYGYYSNQNVGLVSIAVNKIDYEQTQYLTRSDKVEYIPIGHIVALTTGIRNRQNYSTLPYIGTKFSYGTTSSIGFLGADFQWGTYIAKAQQTESAFALRLSYFSNVFSLKNWKFRPFISSRLVYGYNRLEVPNDRISINGDYGIDGFNANLTGTKKALLYFQLQSYAPKFFMGFRANPYLAVSIGTVANSQQSIFSTKIYSSIGIGVVVSNDFMNLGNLQLSIAYYPNIPNVGENVFKINNLRSLNFDFYNFYVGEPNTVGYY